MVSVAFNSWEMKDTKRNLQSSTLRMLTSVIAQSVVCRIGKRYKCVSLETALLPIGYAQVVMYETYFHRAKDEGQGRWKGQVSDYNNRVSKRWNGKSSRLALLFFIYFRTGDK